MEGLKRAGIGVLVTLAALVAGTTADGAETLALHYPEGKSAVYKHKYTLDFQSNHPELIDPSTSGRGVVRILDYGEWVSSETATPVEAEEGKTPPENQVQVTARILKAESQPKVANVPLSVGRFPHTLENFTDRGFSWRVTNGDSVTEFSGDFPVYAVSRADMVTDLYQLWIPEAYPVLPDGPVSEGDTWTGSRRFEMEYPGIAQTALHAYDATYKLKDIKKKKGKRLAIVEEKRKLKFRKWLFMDKVTILVDGEGEASGEWTIDLDQQLVNSHKTKLKIKRPSISTAGTDVAHHQVKSNMTLVTETKLERVE